MFWLRAFPRDQGPWLDLTDPDSSPQFCSSPPPSFVVTHDFFVAKITQISDFLNAFLNFRNVAKCAASIKRLKTKNASASGGFASLSPDQRLCPWTPLGALPQTPVIGSRYRARHGAVPRRYFGIVEPLVPSPSYSICPWHLNLICPTN